VKVRLGRVVKGEQKGVDALISRGLMTLARERAIARAYLLAGDEDLREGVVAAQDMGVQVVLLGVPTSQRTNQSAALMREGDEHVVLPKDFWDRFFTGRGSRELPVRRRQRRSQPTRRQPDGHSHCGGSMESKPRKSAICSPSSPRIPHELDLALLVDAEKTLGSLRERQDLKRELPGAFWATLKKAAQSAPAA
jgi:hypothetical protein